MLLALDSEDDIGNDERIIDGAEDSLPLPEGRKRQYVESVMHAG